MTIETILIMMFLGEAFLLFPGRKLILKLARKLDEAVEELRKGN